MRCCSCSHRCRVAREKQPLPLPTLVKLDKLRNWDDTIKRGTETGMAYALSLSLSTFDCHKTITTTRLLPPHVHDRCLGSFIILLMFAVALRPSKSHTPAPGSSFFALASFCVYFCPFQCQRSPIIFSTYLASPFQLERAQRPKIGDKKFSLRVRLREAQLESGFMNGYRSGPESCPLWPTLHD